MGSPTNKISVTSFSADAFSRSLAVASLGSPDRISDQVDYLARYASLLDAKTVVCEDHYVDRHYLDEFAHYYSRTLRPVDRSVRRFHLFSEAFSEADFRTRLRESATSVDTRKDIESKFSDAYLGFVSVRPMPSVPVGRTILKRLGGPREIWATGRHEVHLANLKIHVDGLPFQQQDSAVGACATAALWSALSRMARMDGMRAPTPAEISELAVRDRGARARGPSTGLTMGQLVDATKAAGFTAEIVNTQKPELFAVSVQTYLRSGIPVVLGLLREDMGHAVTAVGYNLATISSPLLELALPTPSSRLYKLYVHDDRMGPYARAPLTPFSAPHPNNARAGVIEGVTLALDDGPWLVAGALVPVYPKLRLSMRSLLLVGELTAKWLDQALDSKDASNLSVEFFYARSGEYLAGLSGRLLRDADQFLSTVALSRWCAVVQWAYSGHPVAEFVFDTTDVVREGPELLRAIVCLDARFDSAMGMIAQAMQIPMV